MLMEHQTTKPERIKKTIANCTKKLPEQIVKLLLVLERLNSPVEFHVKNDQPIKNLDKLTMYFFDQKFMGFSMVILVSPYLLEKHKQICFIIPYSICT